MDKYPIQWGMGWDWEKQCYRGAFHLHEKRVFPVRNKIELNGPLPLKNVGNLPEYLSEVKR